MDIAKTYAEFLQSLPLEEITDDIEKAFAKAWYLIRGSGGTRNYDKIMVAISGGADSDIMLDLVERVGHPDVEVVYVFYNTGLEYEATHRHLKNLEQKYGISIHSRRAAVPVPVGVKQYGYPFVSKKVSDYIHRLQSHDFKWEDRSFEELYKEYPTCKVALKWWCNAWGEGSRMNISNWKWLKEFMLEQPPMIPIGDGCCTGAKKRTAHLAEKDLNPDLLLQGVRRSEGGSRATAYSSCFSEVYGGCDLYRPLYWFKKADKKVYADVFDVCHSACYTQYGLPRTGCACCPFGNFEKELEAAKQYEPKLYKAAMNVFGPAYEYTRAYHEFRDRMEQST